MVDSSTIKADALGCVPKGGLSFSGAVAYLLLGCAPAASYSAIAGLWRFHSFALRVSALLVLVFRALLPLATTILLAKWLKTDGPLVAMIRH
jgi:hypothetical protein